MAGPSVVDMRHQHHSIDYVEIQVDDVPAAKAFYGGVFGWRFNDYGEAYAGIRDPSGDGEVGGLGVGRPSGPGGSLVILYSDDLDASVAAVRAAGGSITEAPYEFPGGRRFLFADTSGNQLAVWTQA